MKDFQSIHQIANYWAGVITGQVFYLPILGPTYSMGSVDGLLFDILNNSAEEKFLAYDKNRRWLKSKAEKIILAEIVVNDDLLFVPVINTISKNILKIFCYGHKPLNDGSIEFINQIVDKIKPIENFGQCIVYSFVKPWDINQYRCHNIYVKKIAGNDKLTHDLDDVKYYQDLPQTIQQTFSNLKADSDLDGFDFLWDRYLFHQRVVSPILCAVKDKMVVGAIGPLDVFNDFYNIQFLLPPYFGVSNNFRGLGYGQKLWQQAMSWAYTSGAQYLLVQNESNSPAAKFYEKQDLIVGGRVYSFSFVLFHSL